jgi:Cu+-exporting ATPase
MAASSLSVVGNANRLRRYHPAPLPAVEVADLEPQVQAGSGPRHDTAEQDYGQQGHASSAHGRTGHADDGPALGATVTDPVCGMLVNPKTAAAHRDTSGRALYFCSAGCATVFDAEPERYAATTGTADC